jgi:hypothetical protein
MSRMCLTLLMLEARPPPEFRGHVRLGEDLLSRAYTQLTLSDSRMLWNIIPELWGLHQRLTWQFYSTVKLTTRVHEDEPYGGRRNCITAGK